MVFGSAFSEDHQGLDVILSRLADFAFGFPGISQVVPSYAYTGMTGAKVFKIAG